MSEFPAGAKINEFLRAPLSHRLFAGSLIAAGSVAVALGGGSSAEAKTTSLPAVKPATPAPAKKPATPNSYLIKWGDTLTSIAARNNTTVGALTGANGITPNTKIYAGKWLTIPPAAAK